MPRPSKKSVKPARKGRPPARAPAPHPHARGELPAANAPEDVLHLRELFWNNVMREMLTSLASMTASGKGLPGSAKDEAKNTEPGGEAQDHAPFDGRLAVITTTGARIPIAGVYPLFACGVPGSLAERVLSVAVECTVFQIHTPSGEVYTLPLREIRGFHALTEDLIDRITEAAKEEQGEETSDQPFGFAAFTSLARGVPSQRLSSLSDEPAL